nr:T9SS type A sorting domain-containing protein [Candidatus Kapabacteria bacterium]
GLDPQIANYTIETPSEILDRVDIVFYDEFGNLLDTAHCTRENTGSNIWHCSYDMATLIPPTAKGIVSIFLDNQIKSQISFIVEIIPTRPAFLQGAEADITEVKDEGNGKYSFSYGRLIGLVSELDNKNTADLTTLDKVLYFILGAEDQSSASIPALFNADMIYDSNNGQFELVPNTSKVTTMASFLTPSGDLAKVMYGITSMWMSIAKNWYKLAKETMPSFLKNAGMVSFSSDIGSEYEVKLENNELEISSLNTKRRAVNLSFKKINEWFEEVTRVAKVIEKLGKGSGIIAPKIDMDFSTGVSVANHIKYGLDGEKWGPAGDIHIAPKSENNSSFNIMSSGLDIDLNVGVSIACGLVELYIVIANAFDVAWGKAWNMHQDRDLLSVGYTLSLGARTSIAWGILKFWIIKPFLVAHPAYGDQLYPWYQSKVVESGLQSPSKSRYSADMLAPHTYPNPYSDEYNGINAISWLEQDYATGYGSVKIAIKTPDDLQFQKSVSIENNFNSISNPISAIINDSIITVVWEQSRLNSDNLTQLGNQITISDVIYAQDIYSAVYDFKNNEILFKGIVSENESNELFSDAEGMPQITRLNDNSALIAWISLNKDEQNSKIQYAVLKSDNKWNVSDVNEFGRSEGNQTKLRITNDGQGKAIATWISDYSHLQDNKQELLFSVYDSRTEQIQKNNIIATNQNGDEHFNYFDIEIKNNKGGIILSKYHKEQKEQRQKESIVLFEYNNTFSNSPVQIHSDSGKHHTSPQIAVSNTGNAIIMFNQIEYGNEVTNRISTHSKFYANRIGTNNDWRKIDLVHSFPQPDNLIFKSDIKFLSNDTVLILTNEAEPSFSNRYSEPKTGSIIGSPKMNIIARIFHFADTTTSILDEHIFSPLVQLDLPDISIIPNPPSANTIIQITSEGNMKAEFELVNMQGIKVLTLYNDMLLKGVTELNFDFTVFPQGTYLLYLKTPNGVKSQKLMIMN